MKEPLPIQAVTGTGSHPTKGWEVHAVVALDSGEEVEFKTWGHTKEEAEGDAHEICRLVFDGFSRTRGTP